MKLNLGSGDDRRAGYTNVDLREDVADLVADITNLAGIEDGAAEEILALDVLEHFPARRTADILAEWRRVLGYNGRLVVRVPNLDLICALISQGRMVEALIRNLYGGNRWGPDGLWDAHRTGWTPDLLETELKKAGFVVDSNSYELNMTVEATKAGG